MKRRALLLSIMAFSMTAYSAVSAANQEEVEDTVVETATMTDESEDEKTRVLSHAFGEIEVSESPQNVVAIAWGNPDIPLALGVVPVGVSEANFGPRDENGLLPWTAQAFEELGATPNVFSDTDGWDYEAISDTNPDIILAAYSGISQEEYDRLSEIAPVMAYPEMAWATTWREEALNDAIAMNLEQEGQTLIEEIDQMLVEKLQEYPELEGKSTAFLWLSADDLGTFYAYTPLDPRANFLNDLGLKTPDSIMKLANDTDFSVTLSAENADMLNDVEIIITYGDESLIDTLKADKRFASIPAVQNEAYVLLDSNENLAAASTPTVLSIPYCIDEYLEALQEAALKCE